MMRAELAKPCPFVASPVSAPPNLAGHANLEVP